MKILNNSFPLLKAMTVVIACGITFFNCSGIENDERDYVDWDQPGGNTHQTKFSPLTQINKSNVGKLEVAWIYNSGDMSGNVQLNPLIIEGIMYVTTPSQELIAVDASNGQELWRFNPARQGERFGGINRGIGHWASNVGGRLLYTARNFLYAVDMKTGEPVLSFGDGGRVDLNEGLVKPAEQMAITSPGAPVIIKIM